MKLRWLKFCALVFTGLAMVPALAHLSELPAKLRLSLGEYLIAQQLYRGWALFGAAVLAALGSTLALTWATRGRRTVSPLACLAAFCIAGTQVVFWTFTQPANAVTENWTVLPADWQSIRRAWEYSHAFSAVLNLAAFVAVSLAVSLEREASSGPA